jgi:hypothetical protein
MVSGAVLDAATGQPLAGALVVLSDLDRAATTDARGRYGFRNVPPGPQHLSARFYGYAPRTVHALVPRDGELEITVALTAVATRLATVEIRPRVAVRGTDPARVDDFSDRSMSIAAIRNHPLLAEPDVLEAIGGGEVAIDPELPSGVHLRGASADQTAYLLDGFPVFSPYHAAGMFGAFNPDAVDEIAIWSASMSPEFAAVLGGVVGALTRRPGARMSARGSVSATQARATVDGQLGSWPVGYMLSERTGFPGLLASTRDASHIKGESGDRLATVEGTLAMGSLRALYYESFNEISAASDTLPARRPARNAFEWESRTMGGEWRRQRGGMTAEVRGWIASGSSEALWRPDTALVERWESARRDAGAMASLDYRTGASFTSVALRLERSRTVSTLDRRREEEPGNASGMRELLGASSRIATLFVRHERPLGNRFTLLTEGSAARTGGATYLSPGVAVNWMPGDRFKISGAYAARHQFAQSLRNDESLVRAIFPAEPFVGAGAPGIPVAHGDQIVLSASVLPRTYLRLTAQGYARRSGGLVLVAAATDQPFTLGDFQTGSSVSRGASIEASVSGQRYAALASYGWQHTRVEHDAGHYAPHYAAAHRLDAGIVAFPATTFSLRFGVTGITGRTSTPARGALEWESCNLLDLGCEFGGSPQTRPSDLGARGLPPYLRMDIGARKHWHIRARQRDLALTLFGTVTNVVGRANTLAYTIDNSTGQQRPIEMRPLAPLVVGLDWQF